jgi:predicted DNA-binding transcriptional regulator YafY
VDDKYYLVTYSERFGDYTHYRVDRMAAITVLDAPVPKIPEVSAFDIRSYCQRAFAMYGGDDVSVVLRINGELIGAMLDKFGMELPVYPLGDNTAQVHITVKKSRTFFGWLAQFGRDVVVENPESLAAEYAGYLREIAACYAGEQ